MWSTALATLTLVASAAGADPAFQYRARPYDVTHYKIEMRLKTDGTHQSTASVTLVPKSTLRLVELDAYGLEIASVKDAAGAAAKFTLQRSDATGTGRLLITPARPLPAGKDATLVIQYSGKASQQQAGLFESQVRSRSGLPQFFTFMQPSYAQRVFPCNDQPDDKASTETITVVDGRYTVVSNGKLMKNEAFSENGENLRRVHWLQEKPHSTYLVALAVAELERVPVSDEPPSALYVPVGKASQAHFAAEVTRHAMRHQTKFLGVPYPWVKYDQVAVPHFTWGGMENTSATFMRESRFLLEHPNYHYGRRSIVGLLAHELAHQWFGNLVTLRWWNDVWLNEGFATYMANVTADDYYENDYIETSRAYSIFVNYFREEDGPHAHPLMNKGNIAPADLFDGTSYTKGGHVLRMVEHWMGTDAFRAGLKTYLEKYAGKATTSKDFFDTLAQVGGLSKDKAFARFRETWLNQKGYPVVTPTVNVSGNTVTLTVRQRPNHASEKAPFVFKLPVVLRRTSEPRFDKEVVILMDKPQVTVKVETPAAPEWINWNHDGTALTRVESSAVGEQEWISAARHDPDPVWRLLASYVLLGELVRPEAKEPTSPTDAALLAIQDVLRQDPSPYVRAMVLRRLSESKWKRLPSELGPVLVELAKLPKGLPEDAMGTIMVRRGALEVLGKVDSKEGRELLLDGVLRADADLNYLSSYATGTALLGDSVALATLRAAVEQQKPRGESYFQAVAPALGQVPSADAVPVLSELFENNSRNNELLAQLGDRLKVNKVLTQAAAFPGLVQKVVLEPDRYDEESRARILGLLGDVVTPEAKETLSAIAQTSTSQRLRQSAQRTLAKNFAAPTTAPASAKSKSKK